MNNINKKFWFEYQGDSITDCKTIVGYNIPGVNKQKIQYPNNFQVEPCCIVYNNSVEGWIKSSSIRIEHNDILNFELTIEKHDRTDPPPPPPEKMPSEPVRFTKDDFPKLGK